MCLVHDRERPVANHPITDSRAPRLPDVTIARLLSELDRRDVVSTLNRLKAGYKLRVVK
jgi:hypothetical protein